MNQPKRRLAVLLTHPVQYFKPVFTGLAADPTIETRVFFGCDHGTTRSLDPDFGVAFAWDSAPTEGYTHTFLSREPLEALSRPDPGLGLARRANRTIRAWRPDAVLIFSYSPLFITASSLLLAPRGPRLWLRAETTDEALERSAWKGRLRDLALRRFYRRFDHVFPIGSHGWGWGPSGAPRPGTRWIGSFLRGRSGTGVRGARPCAMSWASPPTRWCCCLWARSARRKTPC
jgi:hypothetical protein